MTIAQNTPISQPIDQPIDMEQGLLNFRISLGRILELLDLEPEDEYGVLRPTEYAVKTAIKFIVESYDMMGDNFPKCSVATDDEGSITLDWTRLNPDRSVRLFCPFTSEKLAYLYHHNVSESGVNNKILPSQLADWLKSKIVWISTNL